MRSASKTTKMRRLGRPRARSRGPSRLIPTTSSTASYIVSLLVLCFFACCAAAGSRQRNPLRTIARVEDPVLHAPSHRIHALSTFQITLTLHQEGSGRRLPVRLRLEPNPNIFADDAAIYHMNDDGSVAETEPINRLDHRVYMGHAFVQTGHSLVAGNINDNHWINAGWASIYVHEDGEHPVFEGSFHLGGDHHHIQTSHNYLDTRIAGDPLIAQEGREYMVVWRDSDVLPDAASNDVELRRRLLERGSDYDETDGNATAAAVDGMSLLSPACSSDGLLFNQDNLHPVYTGLDVSNAGSNVAQRHNDAHRNSRWIFGRQIDGGSSGGNSAGVNLTSTIGNTAGCPTARKVALMGIAADCNYASSFTSRANVSSNIIQQINSASRVYESTFNISLGIQNLVIQNNSCPSDSASSAAPWNAPCSSSLTITDRLNLFSKWRGESANDTNAFWMLLSTCNTGSAVGLAWLGQLCVAGSRTDGANETVAAANVVVRTSTEWQVMAHETGHTFGAVHDCVAQTCSDGTVTMQQCCPLSADTCSANGQYIMNPSAGGGITQFSPCSVGNICSAMGRNSVKSSCLSNNKNVVTVTGSQCGNGIVEEGEQCDCGGTEGCGSNSCCDPTTCKFRTNSLCDPSNDECCTSTCQLAGAGVVCRASTGSCDPQEMCSGTTASCPDDVSSPDGTTCGTSGAGLSCASGQCTSRDLQCKTLMGSLTTTNDTYACSSQGCQLSCASPQFGANTCLSMNQNFLDGTSCEGGGHCNNGKCEDVSVGKEIVQAFRNNLDIVIPVSIVVGILVVLAVTSCVYTAIRRRRRTRRIRELTRNGMPPPPPPVSRSGGWFRSRGPSGNDPYGPNGGGNYGGGSGGYNTARNVVPKPEGSPSSMNGSPPSRWAFWTSKNSNANNAPFPATTQNTHPENFGMMPVSGRGTAAGYGDNRGSYGGMPPPPPPDWRGPSSGGGINTPPPPYMRASPGYRPRLERFA